MTTPRQPVVAHPRSATADAEPARCNLRGNPRDEAENHHTTRAAATRTPLGAATRARPESLKASMHYRDRHALGFMLKRPLSILKAALRAAAVRVLARCGPVLADMLRVSPALRFS
jgi:hypothetical protein